MSRESTSTCADSRDAREASGIVRIAAMGDTMLGRRVGERFRARPEDFTMPAIADFLRAHDIVFLNLECPVSANGRPDPIQKPNVTFRAEPATLQILKDLGVTVVSLGNNHMLDYGPEALSDTLRHLDDAGIRRTGAGHDYEEANAPLHLEFGNSRIAFLSHVLIYSASTRMATRHDAGVSDHRIERILARIRALRSQGYVVVVSLHWGLEYAFYPLPYQRRQAKKMIEAGASLILGHGPHYAQGIESYGHGQIVYSLGNFVFDEPYAYSNRSFIFSVGLRPDGELVEPRITPVQIGESHVPQLCDGRSRERMLRMVDALSQAYLRVDDRLWRKISSRYFSDIVNRVLSAKSTRFLSLAPISFYMDVGVTNGLKKLRLRNLRAVAQKLSRQR
jgi:poly-gamma-glutamate synthesis protein (capsule biosynthesis protein)